jgi:hypothetical protein
LNINDIQADAPQDGDWLKNIFRRQAELETKYEGIEQDNGFYVPEMPVDLDNHRDQLFLKDAAYRAVEEISEATNCLKNKPWKQTHVPTDKEHFFEEAADATHFWIRFWLYIFGPDPDDAAEAMYKFYFKKSEVNKFRQESKY